MKAFKAKTDNQLLDELRGHLMEANKIVDTLKVRDSLMVISCQDGKKKRSR